MKRVVLIASVVGLQGCIESRTPAQEPDDAGVPDRGPPTDALDMPPDARPPRTPDRGLPSDQLDSALDAEPPDAGSVHAPDMATRPPDQGPLGPQCPPEGLGQVVLGVCVWRSDGAPVASGSVDLTLASRAVVPVEALPIECQPEGPGLVLGRLGVADQLRLYEGVDDAGQRWTLVFSLPAEPPLPEARFRLTVATQGSDFLEPFGSVLVTDERGLSTWTAAGPGRFADFEYGPMRVERGVQACFGEEPGEGGCTFTGYDIQATVGPQTARLAFGEHASLGDAYTVFHGGLMSIGDRGACNAGPEIYGLAAMRRVLRP